MFYQTKIKIWLSISAVSFFLFEMGSLYDEGLSFISSVEDVVQLMVDALLCGLFSAISCVCSYTLLRYQDSSLKRGRISMGTIGIVILLLNFLTALVINMVYDHIYPLYAFQDIFDNIYYSCMMSSLCSFIILMHYYGRIISSYERERQVMAIKILRFQLNPHFVFNSLNFLVGLIDVNPAEAERFTIKLSRVYRYITKSIGKDLVSTEEAISHAREYCNILQLRYPDSFDCAIQGEPNGYILPMALQVLIENAIKHNTPSPENKLSIDIRCESDYVVVSNNIIRGNVHPDFVPSDGVGLANIFDQYSLIGDKKPVIRSKDGTFRICLPIIKEYECNV